MHAEYADVVTADSQLGPTDTHFTKPTPCCAAAITLSVLHLRCRCQSTLQPARKQCLLKCVQAVVHRPRLKMHAVQHPQDLAPLQQPMNLPLSARLVFVLVLCTCYATLCCAVLGGAVLGWAVLGTALGLARIMHPSCSCHSYVSYRFVL